MIETTLLDWRKNPPLPAGIEPGPIRASYLQGAVALPTTPPLPALDNNIFYFISQNVKCYSSGYLTFLDGAGEVGIRSELKITVHI